MTKNIVLGTAALGSKYGITNFSKLPSAREFNRILEYAWDQGVRTFDTAPGYNTEKLIGNFISANKFSKKAKIFTKIPTLRTISNFEDKIFYFLDNTFKKIKMESIEILYFHDPNDIRFIEKNKKFFIDLKTFYPIKKFGYSIYTLEELKLAKLSNLTNTFQVPFNLLNQDFLKYAKNLELHARSIFFQGLLISEKIHKKTTNRKLIISHTKYFDYLKKKGIDPLKLNII